MTEPTNFKEAVDEIPVPSDKLDAILSSSFKKKKVKRFQFSRILKYSAAGVILSFGLISSAYVSPALANFITQIPVMGHVFEHFILKESYYAAYEEISTDIGVSSVSNGVQMDIEKAFFDGNTITLGFVVHSDEGIKTAPLFEKYPGVINDSISNAGYDGEYVEGVGFVGMMTISGLSDTKNTVNVVWKPKSISFDDKTIDGNWRFAFSLDKLEGMLIPINEKVEKDGVTVQLIDATQTDVNLSINYLQDVAPSVHDKWMAVEAELRAIDNLGNEYEVPYTSGTGTKGSGSSEDMTWNATVHGLDPKATSITFYPFAHLSNSQSDWERIDFEPITVELE